MLDVFRRWSRLRVQLDGEPERIQNIIVMKMDSWVSRTMSKLLEPTIQKVREEESSPTINIQLDINKLNCIFIHREVYTILFTLFILVFIQYINI